MICTFHFCCYIITFFYKSCILAPFLALRFLVRLCTPTPWAWPLFLGHGQHVLAKSHFGASKFSKSSRGPEILSKTRKQCAFHENCTRRSFQIMRPTFWPNRIFEHQIFKIVTLALNSRQNWKTVRFPWKLYKRLFSGLAQHVLAKSHFWASKFSKSWNWPQILFKAEKQCAFHENCTKRSFHVMRSTFWPNRILERQSSQNRHAGLKFSRKRENSAPSMKIVQDALFRSCAARFGQIAFLSVKSLKIVTLAWNSLEIGKTVHFSWKLYKTLFSRHAQHFLAKSHFWASKFSKSAPWHEILYKTGKQCTFHENCTKRSFQVMRSTFWPNRIFERQIFKIVTLAWNSRENGKTVHFPWKLYKNAPFRSCAALFGQIKVFKIVKLASNVLQSGKTVRFARKLYKTCFSGHAQHVLAKSNFWAPKFSKSWNWPQILFKAGKQCAFHENCTKRSFHVMRSTFWPNRIFERQSSPNRHLGMKFSTKRENSALSMKIVQDALFRSCAFLQNRKTVRFPRKLDKTRFSGHAQHVLAKSDFWAPKFSKSWTWPQIFAKTGKQCAFHKNCTKRSLQVMRSTFWPNRIFERQISQIRETGLKFSSKRKNSAFFRSCAFLQNRKTVRIFERQSS